MLLHSEQDSKIEGLSSPKARGKRLKFVRKLAGLSRKQLEKKYGISANTVQSWEVAKKGGLTERGAHRILAVIQKEGINCSIEWLLYGTGAPPRPVYSHYFH